MMGRMTWYARPSWRLVRQLIADAFVAAWLIGWWFAGRLADATVRALAGPVRQAAQSADGRWRITEVRMSRSARVLMEGWVRVPAEVLRAGA